MGVSIATTIPIDMAERNKCESHDEKTSSRIQTPPTTVYAERVYMVWKSSANYKAATYDYQHIPHTCYVYVVLMKNDAMHQSVAQVDPVHNYRIKLSFAYDCPFLVYTLSILCTHITKIHSHNKHFRAAVMYWQRVKDAHVSMSVAWAWT